MSTIELDSAPSLPTLYAKAAMGSLLPGGGEELPERELVLRGARLDRDRVAAYARVCGFRLRDTVPGTFPHLLVFPLRLSLMTERSFPFPVLGLVHIANRIEVAGPIPLDSSLELTIRAEGLREHRRGRQFDLVAEGERDGAAVWSERSTYLRREQGEGEPSGSPEREGGTEGEAVDLGASALWSVPADIGRRYAAVSGDRNPIHMHSLSARAFGFPGAIAHGMWTKARCLAAFEGRLPREYAIEIEFQAPLRIPGEARLLSAPREDGWEFAVERPDGERRHATGSITSPSAPAS